MKYGPTHKKKLEASAYNTNDLYKEAEKDSNLTQFLLQDSLWKLLQFFKCPSETVYNPCILGHYSLKIMLPASIFLVSFISILVMGFLAAPRLTTKTMTDNCSSGWDWPRQSSLFFANVISQPDHSMFVLVIRWWAPERQEAAAALVL